MLALQWSTVELLLMWEGRQLHKQRPITSLMLSTRSSVPMGLHWLGTTASTCMLPMKPQSLASRLATGILVVLLVLVSGNWIKYYEISRIMSHDAWWCIYMPMKMCILLVGFDNVAHDLLLNLPVGWLIPIELQDFGKVSLNAQIAKPIGYHWIDIRHWSNAKM